MPTDDLDWTCPAVNKELQTALATVEASDLEGWLDKLPDDARAKIEPLVRAHSESDRQLMAAMMKVIVERRYVDIFENALSGVMGTD